MKDVLDEYKCTHYYDYHMDSNSWHAYLFIQKACSKRTGKERKNGMNESQQPNQPQKESLKLVLIISGFYSLVALGIILKLLGLF